jgi:hypothetical protein
MCQVVPLSCRPLFVGLLTWRFHVVIVVSMCSGGSGRRMVAVEGGGCRSRWWVVNVGGGDGSERKLIVDC